MAKLSGRLALKCVSCCISKQVDVSYFGLMLV
jgi:hypothetical protein